MHDIGSCLPLERCYNLEYYYVIVRMRIILDSNFFVVPLIVYVILHVLLIFPICVVIGRVCVSTTS